MVIRDTQISQYLGWVTNLTVFSGTTNQVDVMMRKMIQEDHAKAYKILKDKEDRLHKSHLI